VTPHSPSQALDRPSGGGLADVVELILDKGLVIDAFARVSVIGIEILTIEVRVVVASIDTYLRYADAMRQLAMAPKRPAGLPELAKGVTAGIAAGKTKGVLDAVTDKIGELVSGDRPAPLHQPRGSR
jgi:hypothetical protein